MGGLGCVGRMGEATGRAIFGDYFLVWALENYDSRRLQPNAA